MASILNSLPQELRKIVREAKDLDAASTNSVTLVQVKENGSFGRSVSLLVGRSVGRLVGLLVGLLRWSSGRSVGVCCVNHVGSFYERKNDDKINKAITKTGVCDE